jgi:regulatory protein
VSTSSDARGSDTAWRGDAALGVAAWIGSRPQARVDERVEIPVTEDDEPDHEAIARQILLDQLTGAARTRKELADKLVKRNVPDEIAQRLLDRFTEVGLIDDASFAREWVASRQQGRGLGQRSPAQELRRKGVADETVREVLDELDPDDEDEAARLLVRRRLRTLTRVDETTATRRLVGMLARKGYPAGVAFAVVRQELATSGREPPEPD